MKKRTLFYLFSKVGMRSLFCVPFLMGIAFLVQPGFAQPPAPVEWGEMRILEDDPEVLAYGIKARGDTIVLIGNYRIGSWYYPMPKVSGDNGETWSDWTVLGDTTRYNSPSTWPFQILDDVILCYGQIDPPTAGWGGFRTYDLGQTWLGPCSVDTVLTGLGTIGDTVVCRVRSDEFTWTADDGCTYAPARDIPFLWNAIAFEMSASNTYIHTGSRKVDPSDQRAKWQYTRSSWAGEFEPVRIMNPNFFWVDRGYMVFDRLGNGIILTLVEYAPPAPTHAAVVVNYTHDDGTTWSEPDTLTPFESANSVVATIDHDNGIWVATWFDTTISPGFDTTGFRCGLSMNRGRAWYPTMQISNIGIRSGGHEDVDIQGNRIRLYGFIFELGQGNYVNYFTQWEGIVTIDSTAPELATALELPQLVPADTLLDLWTLAFDTDSLWLMQFVARSFAGDSVVIPLTRLDDSEFSAQWQVPSDTTLWYYYYHAEDMWENISYYPEGGPENPLEMHVGEIQSARVRPTSPTEFSLSIFPNPSNGNFTITGSYTRGTKPEAIAVYDILGREVTRLTVPAGTGPTFTLHWDTEDSRGIPLPTGTYFIQPDFAFVNSGVRSLTVIR